MSEEMTKKEKENIRLMIVERTFTLLTAAMSLVAALAWNDAIQSLFREIFGTAASIYAKFFYALIVTALTVLIVWRLSRFMDSWKERMKSGAKKVE